MIDQYFFRRLWYTITDIPFLFIVGLVVGLVALMYYSGKAELEAKESFFAECEQYEKHYKCVAMWKEANQRDSTVILIPSSQ